MSFRGQPNFAEAVEVEGTRLFAPWEQGSFALLPSGLAVGERADGRADFRLDLVHGERPDRPPSPYGVLDLRLVAVLPLEAALRAARATRADAVVAPAVPAGAFLRFLKAGDVAHVPEEVWPPAPLSWNALGTARLLKRLSVDSAVFLKGSLEGQWAGFEAGVEIEYAGVSPCLPLQVRFDPAALLDALAARAALGRIIARRELEAIFFGGSEIVPLRLSAPLAEEQRPRFAEAMADRVRERFGRFVPAPGEAPEGSLELASSADVGTGEFAWDLSVPQLAHRPLALRFDAFAAARDRVIADGIDAVVSMTVVPALDLGHAEVQVLGNLPGNRVNAPLLSASVVFPPRPPERPQAVVRTAELTPPADAQRLAVRLAPGESLRYAVTTQAVVLSNRGLESWEGPTREAEGRFLDLTSQDFAVDFLPFSASSALLSLCDIHGRCWRAVGGNPFEAAFALSRDNPEATVALPKGPELPQAELEARPHGSGGALTLHLTGPGARLDLSSFREYGPHRLDIECEPAPEEALVALDLLPEAATEGEETVLTFTAAAPRREWTYLAVSPFHAGYRFRRHAGTDGRVLPWSEVRTPFAPLVVPAGAEHGTEVKR